ncbi:RNA 3'-terminal phosphate cyclase [Desulfurococcaceae archaeon MEX13E-LK6-19]|nr:RNA 3'-terminal phosphate cyclase [Desulfurococcaceae archaeon MEX13E-LK6-19]
MANEYIEIDGSMGEGGGQILRYSLALSSLLLKPVHIYNIRAKRSNPGLRPQHLTAVRALAQISNAEVKGDRVGSMELWFKPSARKGGVYKFNIGTAGSVTLVIQAILPALIFSDKDSFVEITGGTDVPWSPTIDYMRYVFAENMRRLFGMNISIDVKKRGHYPRGGGHVILKIERMRSHINSIDIVERKAIKAIKGRSHCVRLPSHVAVRQAKSAEKYIYQKLGIKPIIDVEYYERKSDPHLGPGSGIVLYADCIDTVIGADSIGARGKPAEKVGEEAASKLVEELSTKMAFDRHMGDMLIPYVSLACGESRIGVAKLTMHTVTALEVTKKFLPELKYYIEGRIDEPAIIKVSGVCFKV